MNVTTAERNRQVVDKIRATKLYQSYAEAFQDLTGLTLYLQPMHGDAGSGGAWAPASFCGLLNGGGSQVCRACRSMHHQVMRDAVERAVTAPCPLGLTESAVPVRFGEETIALLRTGQVRHEKPVAADLRKLAEVLRDQGVEEEGMDRLLAAYERVSVIDAETYEQTVTMLAIFSLHLTSLIDQLILAHGEAEPVVVTEAKRYIEEHLDEKLTLEELSNAVNVSPFYFCKIFKQATGMTFTEYVNRLRVDWAKRELRKPHVTVTEVAFEVGYQSLSQFNRSFLRYAGESPTQFRKHQHQDRDRHHHRRGSQLMQAKVA